MNYILIGIGGAIGAALRYFLSMIPVSTVFPFITLGINYVGSFALGYLFYRVINHKSRYYTFFTTGLISGFTTFSTFSFETISLIEHAAYQEAFTYIIASIIGSIFFALTGSFLAKGGRI